MEKQVAGVFEMTSYDKETFDKLKRETAKAKILLTESDARFNSAKSRFDHFWDSHLDDLFAMLDNAPKVSGNDAKIVDQAIFVKEGLKNTKFRGTHSLSRIANATSLAAGALISIEMRQATITSEYLSNTMDRVAKLLQSFSSNENPTGLERPEKLIKGLAEASKNAYDVINELVLLNNIASLFFEHRECSMRQALDKIEPDFIASFKANLEAVNRQAKALHHSDITEFANLVTNELSNFSYDGTIESIFVSLAVPTIILVKVASNIELEPKEKIQLIRLLSEFGASLKRGNAQWEDYMNRYEAYSKRLGNIFQANRLSIV